MQRQKGIISVVYSAKILSSKMLMDLMIKHVPICAVSLFYAMSAMWSFILIHSKHSSSNTCNIKSEVVDEYRKQLERGLFSLIEIVVLSVS